MAKKRYLSEWRCLGCGEVILLDTHVLLFDAHVLLFDTHVLLFDAHALLFDTHVLLFDAHALMFDTHVLLFDALEPKRLSRLAREALAEGTDSGTLSCSDMSLWEIAMLIARGRIKPQADAALFIEKVIQSRSIAVLPITPKIAVLSQSDTFTHGDPADRLIAATALAHRARLVSADERLRKLKVIDVVW